MIFKIFIIETPRQASPLSGKREEMWWLFPILKLTFWPFQLIWAVWSFLQGVADAHDKAMFVWQAVRRFILFLFPGLELSQYKPLDPNSGIAKTVDEHGDTILTHTQEQKIRRFSLTQTKRTIRVFAYILLGFVIAWIVLWAIALGVHMIQASSTVATLSYNYAEDHKRKFTECTADRIFDRPASPQREACILARDVVNNRVKYDSWSKWSSLVYESQTTFGFFSLSDITRNLTRVSTNGWINLFVKLIPFTATILMVAVLFDFTDGPDDGEIAATVSSVVVARANAAAAAAAAAAVPTKLEPGKPQAPTSVNREEKILPE